MNRLKRIAAFTHDALVMKLLTLKKGLNNDVISVRLKQLAQAGAIPLQEHLFGLTRKWLKNSALVTATVDADSTVKTVYGHQEGAAKGFNHQKKGANNCYLLLAFKIEPPDGFEPTTY